MNQLNTEQLAWSRNMQTQILQAMQSVSQADMAKAIGVDASTLSRLKDTHLERLCQLLALAELKVVGRDMQCYQKDKVDILFKLAKEHLNRAEELDDFFHDDASKQVRAGTYQPQHRLTGFETK